MDICGHFVSSLWKKDSGTRFLRRGAAAVVSEDEFAEGVGGIGVLDVASGSPGGDESAGVGVHASAPCAIIGPNSLLSICSESATHRFAALAHCSMSCSCRPSISQLAGLPWQLEALPPAAKLAVA